MTQYTCKCNKAHNSLAFGDTLGGLVPPSVKNTSLPTAVVLFVSLCFDLNEEILCFDLNEEIL